MKNMIISAMAGVIACQCLPELRAVDHMALFCGVWMIIMYAACAADVAVERGRRKKNELIRNRCCGHGMH